MRRSPCAGSRLDAHLPTLHMSRHSLLATGTSLWTWTAFPPGASVGHKLYTAAWSRILRPTNKCGPCGFRWPRHGRNWLKRWSGYSRIKGRAMRMVTAQDKPKSRLETDAPLGPKCKTRMQVRTLPPGESSTMWTIGARNAEKGPCERATRAVGLDPTTR